MAQTYLTKQSPTAGNRQKGTLSMWVKRSKLGASQYIYSEWQDGQDHGIIYFSSADQLQIISNDGASASLQIGTNRKFRDTNAWYHIVVAWDTTQATANNRVKLYVNGQQETNLSTNSQPSQNFNTKFGLGSDYHIYIGRRGDNQDYFDGSMSHVHRVDNQQLNASVFGSTDSTTGEWNITTSPSITYTGSSSFNFFILKDGNSVTDQSGQSNNLTVGYGTLSKTEDCPSNVFATLNPLFLSLPTGGLSNGNTTATTAGADSTWRSAFGNLGATSGKYYMEVKWVSGSHFVSGFASQKTLSTHNFKDLTDVYSGGQYFGIYGTQLYTNGSASGSYTTQASGNIIQLALDMDNKKIYQGINGTWNVGGNPSSGNGISISGDTDEFWTFGISVYSNSGTGEYHANFGNGYFATTAVSSAGTNASGNGIFEYDCPNGYTALSTKGLNT